MKRKKKIERRNENSSVQNSCSRLCSSESNYYHCFTNSTYISHRWITFSFFQDSTHVRRHLLPLYIAKTILMKLLLLQLQLYRVYSISAGIPYDKFFSFTGKLYIHRFIRVIYNCLHQRCRKFSQNPFLSSLYLFIYLNE